MKIVGIEGMTVNDLNAEVARGGKFVIVQYCISVVIITFKRPSDIYFVRAGETGMGQGILFTVISLFLGWWGIPWGPIYTIQSVVRNMSGGKDVTAEVLASIAKP